MRKFFLAPLLVIIFLNRTHCQIQLRSVDDALQIALANDVEFSLQRQSAQENVRLAKKNIVEFFPVFDFSITDGARAQKDVDDTKSKSIEIGLTQKIFNGGKTVLNWQMQKESSFYQFLNFQKSFENFNNSIVQCYYNTLLLNLKSELLEKTIDNAKDVLLLAELEKDQGMIVNTEYLETVLEYKKLELELCDAINECEKSANELKKLLNIRRDQSLNFSERGKFLEALDSYLLFDNLSKRFGQLKESALQNSVDLKICGAELNWAKKQRSMQKRFLLPSVSVRGGISFCGRNYPLTSPEYSIKVILNFEDNPWTQLSISRQNGFSKGKMNSLRDSLSGQGIINTVYFSQMRLNKIEIAQRKVGLEKAKKQIEESVAEMIQEIERAQKSFLLCLENAKLKEQKLALSKLQLEQGRIKKNEYLENLNESAKEKIKCLSLLKERDFLCAKLESFSGTKL